jgi:hypothetical protein
MQQSGQPETKRWTAHQHQRGQLIVVDTNQDARPEAGRIVSAKTHAATVIAQRSGPAGEADDSAPVVERHDANSDRNQHRGHAEQHAVGATNDVDSVLVAASGEHRAGIDRRGTDADQRRGKQCNRRDQDTRPYTASPVSRTTIAVFASPSNATTVPRMR